MKLRRIEQNAHRHALHDLDPVSRSVLRGQERKGAAAARAEDRVINIPSEDVTKSIPEFARQENVQIDAKDQHPTLSNRSEESTTLTVTAVRNHAGKVLVEKNEAGAYTFTVYNAENQKIYQVNPEGTLIEWQYDTFPEPVAEIAYATKLTLDFSQYIETGIPPAIIEQNKKTSRTKWSGWLMLKLSSIR